MIDLPVELVHKIEWAEYLLRQLDERVHEFTDRDPIGVRAAIDPEVNVTPGHQTWVVYGEVRETPPPELALLAGDVLQNTRAALDYLARALVLTSGGTPKEGAGGTQFPILVAHPKREPTIAGCQSSELLEVVTGLQPYRSDRPERHPLARLNALNNANKHHTIPTVVGAGGFPAAIGLYTTEPVPRGMVIPFARWFFDGDRLDPLLVELPVGVEPVADAHLGRAEVAFEVDAWNTVGLARELNFYLSTVRDHVIPSFRSFFGPSWPDDVFAFTDIADPFGALPALNVELLDRRVRALHDRARGSRDVAHILDGQLWPGVSVAQGYVTGGAPLAGPTLGHPGVS